MRRDDTKAAEVAIAINIKENGCLGRPKNRQNIENDS
jgi:hypothetical protein